MRREMKNGDKTNVHSSFRFLPLTTIPRHYFTVHIVPVTSSADCQCICSLGKHSFTLMAETLMLTGHQRHLGNMGVAMVSNAKDSVPASFGIQKLPFKPG